MSMTESESKSIAIYHEMRPRDTFETTAEALVEIVALAQQKSPGQRRVLYLDVTGHRNKAGGFDRDAYELMHDFAPEHIWPYVSEVNCPLYHAKNPAAQRNDPPASLVVKTPEESA